MTAKHWRQHKIGLVVVDWRSCRIAGSITIGVVVVVVIGAGWKTQILRREMTENRIKIELVACVGAHVTSFDV